MANKGYEMEEIDLSDRRGLIAMAELYSGNTTAYTNNAFDDGTTVNFIRNKSNKEDITNILHNIGDQSSSNQDKVIKSSSSSPKKDMATVSAENGTAKTGKYTPHRKNTVSCSYSTLFVIILAMVALLALAVVASYLLFHHGVANQPMSMNYSNNLNKSDITTEMPPALEVTDETPVGPSAKDLRLPTNLEPLWYNLSMRVYVPGFIDIPKERELTFSAALIIKFFVKKATNVIELNSLHLDLPQNTNDYALLVDGVNKPKEVENSEESDSNSTETRSKRSTIRSASGINVTKITIKEDLEKVIFDIDKELEEGKEYYFQFRYMGLISNKLAGLYQTTYTDLNGNLRYAAVTQMEPTDARRMVPCFDEPSFKAIWKLKVFHPKGTKAVSNAIEIEENELDEKVDGFVYTSFDETPRMSSYLLALVVSDFDYIEGYTKRNTRFRIWSRKEAINETDFALYAGIKVLEYYEDYYGITFPLQKQDMMAIPDFAAGAMENWGLVTYREKALLYNPNVYAFHQKQRVATVVAHELAHQWFGNLVTMKWWNDLWLNEGFATLMEYMGVDAINPHYKMDDFFVSDAMDNAFNRDAMATSHPLSFPIEKAEDVSEAFDQISYDKGGSILRMIKSMLGEENFKKGLHIYLSENSYKNAEHEDLWTALTEAVPDNLTTWTGERFDVSDFAKKWTEQMGYPVVTVKTTNTGIVLNQNRFKINNSSQESIRFRNAKYWYHWDVPIWYTVDGHEQSLTWLHTELQLNITKPDSLIFINSESEGFYRVQYDDVQMKKINQELLQDFNSIKMRSRARYIDDSFTLAQAGLLEYENILEMSKYLKNENEFLPINMAINGFHLISGYFGDEPESEDLNEYLRNLLNDKYEQVKDSAFSSKEPSSPSDMETKYYEKAIENIIVRSMCEFKSSDCIRRVLDSYQQQFVLPCRNDTSLMSSQCSQVPVMLRSLIYCYGVKYGGDDDWERMLNYFKKESVQVERDRLMSALTCSRDTFILKKLLKMAANINDTVIRLQDKAHVFAGVGNSHIGSPIVLDFFIDNWPELYKEIKDQQTLLKSFIQYSLSGKTWEKVKRVKEFLTANKATTNNLDVFKQRLELIETNAQWMDKNFKSLAKWFKNQNLNNNSR